MMHATTDPTDATGGSTNGTASPGELIACPGCDLLHRQVTLPVGRSAECQRCGHHLYRNRPQGIDRALALTLAASILFLLANVFPFLSIEIQGIRKEISVLSAAIELFRRGMPELGLFASAVIFVFPLLQLAAMLAVLTPLSRGRATPGATAALRLVSLLAPWSMMEIYLLGVLVSLVKLGTMADITFGVAFWAFSALVVVNLWAASAVDRHYLWQKLESVK
jgi:paraquat-inducible protein A